MASSNESRTCSNLNCKKGSARDFCIGCKSYFCSQHFRQHEQDLAAQFDREVVGLHDKLLDKINKMDARQVSSSKLFTEIEQWKTATIRAVENAAKVARDRLENAINDNKVEAKTKLKSVTDEIRDNEGEKFLENDIERLKLKLNDIDRSLNKILAKDINNSYFVEYDRINWNTAIRVREEQNRVTTLNLPINARWEQNGVTVAGRHGQGENDNQLNHPLGLFVDDDDDQTILIADHGNNRIIQYRKDDAHGQVVAGEDVSVNQSVQLCKPTDVLIDKETNSLIIPDYSNRRVVRWSRRSGSTQGEILLDNISCFALFMDEQRNLYVSDTKEHEVKRYEIDQRDKTGTVVAGGNGQGSDLNQLNEPRYLFVDRNQAVYVSDVRNFRVVKWDRGAKEGTVVAGGQGNGKSLAQLSNPNGVFVDSIGTVYVAEGGENGNHRVTRWPQGAKQGTIVVGGNGEGDGPNQFNRAADMSFDKYGNLYVVDYGNHRVQRFTRL